MSRPRTLLFCAVMAAFCSIVYGWNGDPKVNTQIAPKPLNQIEHSAVSDGAGGAYITWAENINPDR